MNKRIVKKMGYVRDQHGIFQRYARERRNWNEHLQNTKKTIINSVENLNKKETCIILGSGWLLDIPVDVLCKLFHKLVLIDICHPKEIQYKFRKCNNIEWLTHDISNGAIEATYKLSKTSAVNIEQKIKQLKFKPFPMQQNVDIVFSINLLSQIDELAVNYLTKKRKLPPELIHLLRKKIQKQHIKTLQQFRSVLITDIKEVFYNNDNQKKTENNLIFTELPIDKCVDEWTWNFDTQKTFHPEFNTKRIVQAFQF